MPPLLLMVLFAADANHFTPGVPIVAWIVCNARKKQEFGGWLLFYYWQLYSGILVSVFFFSMNFQSYVPENFQDPTKFYLFLVSVLPGLIIFALQVAVATILISVRTWDLLKLLRWLITAQVIAAGVEILIDMKYFPHNVGLGFFTLLSASLWLAYFFVSRRVEHVFWFHDWDVAVNSIYPGQPSIIR